MKFLSDRQSSTKDEYLSTYIHAQVLREGGDLMVRGGRHPLQELSVNQFIDNDTKIGGDSAKLQLITGPNSSGKSVYLKQV